MKACPIMLLKTHVEKMSHFCLAMMFMKTNELKCSSHDVDEKKGNCRFQAASVMRQFLVLV
jgi:hypothetical protein